MSDQRFQKWIFTGNIGMFATLIALLATGAMPQQPRVLTVERLNVVDSAGNLALVLSNGARLPGGTWGGKEYPQSFVGRGRSAGMLFYNEVGDEVGGLIYEGGPRDSTYRAFGHLSFDQWKQNQVVALQYIDNGTARSAGLRVWDRPTDAPLEEQFALAEEMLGLPPGPARDSVNRERLRVRDEVRGIPRVYLGSADRQAQLVMRDPMGRVRARIRADSTGAVLEFLDESGDVTSTYR